MTIFAPANLRCVAGHPRTRVDSAIVLDVTATLLMPTVDSDGLVRQICRVLRLPADAVCPVASPGNVGPGDTSLDDVGETPAIRPNFEQLYTAHVTFIWRSARRLGVRPAAVEDVVQEVFLVAHRKLATFQGDLGVKAWLWRILDNVVHTHRRTQQRKRRFFWGSDDVDPQDLQAPPMLGPESLSERAEANRVLHSLLDELDDDKRRVLVLVELEEMSVVEAAEFLNVNLNTLHSRLRAARRDFDGAAKRYRERTGSEHS